MDWDYGIGVVGPWVLREANFTLKILELSLESIERKNSLMISDLLPEIPKPKLANKTILINHPRSRNTATNQQLEKYAKSILSDAKE